MSTVIPTKFLFVGEKPSKTALAKGWRWEHGRLAAKQLFDALKTAGIDLAHCEFTNWFEPDGPDKVKSFEGTIVALGQKVHRELHQREIEHVQLVHPAARGRIRLKARYAAHVQEALMSGDRNE